MKNAERAFWVGPFPFFVFNFPKGGLMPKIKVGVQIRPQHTTYANYEQAWLRVDELGADSIWNWDHFFPLSGDPNGPHFEGWTTLAAIGPKTKRATVGCLVLSMGYRNPAHLSQMA